MLRQALPNVPSQPRFIRCASSSSTRVGLRETQRAMVLVAAVEAVVVDDQHLGVAGRAGQLAARRRALDPRESSRSPRSARHRTLRAGRRRASARPARRHARPRRRRTRRWSCLPRGRRSWLRSTAPRASRDHGSGMAAGHARSVFLPAAPRPRLRPEVEGRQGRSAATCAVPGSAGGCSSSSGAETMPTP